MLTETEKRAAKLAVSRYGADHAGVERVFRAVLQAQARGESANVLEKLVLEKLLTSSQAEELRVALDVTHLDLSRPRPAARKSSKVVAAPANGKGAAAAPAKDGPSPSLPPDLHTLAGYRLLRQLGEGGMGTVFLAYQEEKDQTVALKVLAEALASSRPYVERFHREARSGALLNHVNIVRTFAVGQDPDTGLHYLVLEFVDGPSAHELQGRFGKLAVADAVHITLDVARALEHAHSRNIIHRDIKPDNILLTRSGIAKLADLGLAKRTDEASHLTAARQGFGTPYYMPYEQATNAKHADGRSDIYALGATLYHLLTGEVPFSGDSHVEIVEKKGLGLFTPASELNPEVPPVLDDILQKMLARDPAERYQTASELIIALERSDLAAAVPSFVDPDLALQDPIVRQRLVALAEPTCLDVNGKPREATPERPARVDVWFLRYRSRRGQWCKTRATTEQVLQRIGEGRLPADVQAAHDMAGPFQPLREHDEFRGAIAALPARTRRKRRVAAEAPPAEVSDRPSARGRTWWLVAGGGLAFSLLMTAAAVVLLRSLWAD
jgi:serine/threonine-protein kinase